jgi:putative hydrolase of the HAD superfamily
MKKSIKSNAVIFDLFGTLVEMFPFEELPRILSQMAEELGIPGADFIELWPRIAFNRVALEPAIECACAACGVRPKPEAIRAAVRTWLDFGRRNLAPRRDAVSTIRRLKAGGQGIGLISNCSMEVPLLWNKTAFAPLVDAPIFSCVVGMNKPNPKVYLFACESLGVKPQDCLYVGDGSDDELAAAAGVGMQPILLRVPGDDAHDTYRCEVNDWGGTTILALEDVQYFVEASSHLPTKTDVGIVASHAIKEQNECSR